MANLGNAGSGTTKAATSVQGITYSTNTKEVITGGDINSVSFPVNITGASYTPKGLVSASVAAHQHGYDAPISHIHKVAGYEESTATGSLTANILAHSHTVTIPKHTHNVNDHSHTVKLK